MGCLFFTRHKTFGLLYETHYFIETRVSITQVGEDFQMLRLLVTIFLWLVAVMESRIQREFNPWLVRGIIINYCAYGHWFLSCASPIFAGVVALLNDALAKEGQPPLGFLNPLLYKMKRESNGLEDVTEGVNQINALWEMSRFKYLATKKFFQNAKYNLWWLFVWFLFIVHN